MKYSILILTLIFCLQSHGQSSDEWTLFKSSEGVEFYKKQTDCNPENIPNQIGIIIKIVNTNSYSIKAEWDLRIWYNGEEQTSNIKDQENHIAEIIPKKESVEGSCDKPNGSLYIFKKFTTFSEGAEMTHFQFDSVTISKSSK
ncbi:MAG: hypothetical protein AB8B72_03395 [Crocinitomicaceae bacterium]